MIKIRKYRASVSQTVGLALQHPSSSRALGSHSSSIVSISIRSGAQVSELISDLDDWLLSECYSGRSVCGRLRLQGEPIGLADHFS
jgi:hypothetical protein